MVPPTTSALALIAKWPKPPPGSGFWPAQISVSCSEAASAAKVPSTFSVGLMLIEPSKAVLNGLPATRSLRPLRLPASAAAKSDSVRLMSSGLSCQTKRPLAPKLLEIDGQASDNATSSNVSVRLRALLRTSTVPFRMRISENPAARGAFGLWLRASVSISPDQLERPSSPRSTTMVGRVSATSAISTRPASSGKKRRRAVSRSAVSAGWPPSPNTTSSKLMLPVGNSLTVVSPRSVGLSPVTMRISLSTWARTASGEIR